MNIYNCEIAEMLKNIRILKGQTELLNRMELQNKENKMINSALEDLSLLITHYLNG